MSDPQTRAADMMASFFWAHSPEYVDHVAAKLAEAGLLTHDPDECAGHCRRVVSERDAARAELAEVKAARDDDLEELVARFNLIQQAEAREAALREGVRALADEWETGGTFWQQRATDLRALLGEQS